MLNSLKYMDLKKKVVKFLQGRNVILVLDDGPSESLKFGPGGNFILVLENSPGQG